MYNLNSLKNHYSAKSYKGIYSLHKYWSKKPFNIIREFIQHYTNEGNVVLDPFCGSGVVISESIFLNRKAIGIDINPMAIFITKNIIRKIDVDKLEMVFKELEKKCKETINSFYKVTRNGKELVGTHFLWKNNQLDEIWYYDKNCKIISLPEKSDIELASSFSYDKIPYFFPNKNFFHNSRINADKTKHIYELFTPRNLFALSFLLNNIESIEDEDIRNILKLGFTSSLGQSSKMVFVVKKRGKYNGKTNTVEKKEVGSWVIGYWLPNEHFEINVWKCFENKIKKIIKTKKEQKLINYSDCEAQNFLDLTNDNKNFLLINESSLEYLNKLPNDSIDYVITDPPHGDRIPYLELSIMWNEWMKFEVNYENEIVISDSKERKKNKDTYFALLKKVIIQIERVLKPNHYFTMIFNTLDDDTWFNLIQIFNELKFDLYKIETMDYSANSVVQDTRNGGLKTDFIFTFQKNEKKLKKSIQICNLKEHKEILYEAINRFVFQNKNEFELFEILNFLIIDLIYQNYFFKISDIIKIINYHFENKGNKWIPKKTLILNL